MDMTLLSGEAALVAIDGGMRIAAWNRASEALLGISRSEAIGRPCHEVMAGRDVHGNPYCCAQCPVVQTRARQLPVRPFELQVEPTDREGPRWVRLIPIVAPGAEGHLYVILPSAAAPASPGRMPDASDRGAPTQPSEDDFGLTPRELEVLRRLHEGQATRAIAAELGISPHTVRNHVQRILQKTSSGTRLEAVAFARRHGLV
jgi:DNA-binding CsgD family transcriptional regulator